MAFKKRSGATVAYKDPIEMYRDNKLKSIDGPLDFQTAIIQNYMKDAYNKHKDVAIELPTGTGKTLIGLLIGEFRRRTNNEKIVFLCPNNLLVHQVVNKANEVFGIKASAFTGSQWDYEPSEKALYTTAKTIAVTNYSSFFNNNTFFSDADVLIFDDAHSSENYIASNWSLNISRMDNKECYLALTDALKDILTVTQYNRMRNDVMLDEDLGWIDLIPNPKFSEYSSIIIPLLDQYTSGSNLKYAWGHLKNYLHACNVYISRKEILIRPYIPPTATYGPFENATQRIYMSATLGNSGDLERFVGVEKIFKLPLSVDWNVNAVGRKFFIFPNVSFKETNNAEIISEINKSVDRILYLTKDDKTRDRISGIFQEKSPTTRIFVSKDLEQNLDDFISCDDAVAILSNRYDGVDMEKDNCHILIIDDIQTSTHSQEQFLITRMAASNLFKERIRTRVVQALGRCTRSDSDYAAVIIFGKSLENELLSPKKIVNYHPELRAEIEFGFEQSQGLEDVSEMLENLEMFLGKTEEWKSAEIDIIDMRNNYIKENAQDETISKVFKGILKHEINYSYNIWKSDFQSALKNVKMIIDELKDPSLKGLKSFWFYQEGCVFYNLFKQTGKELYFENAKKSYSLASTCSTTINWFNNILAPEDEKEIISDEIKLDEILITIEQRFLKYGAKNHNKFEKEAKTIMDLLSSEDGLKFEKGHLLLGQFLGYEAGNPSGDAEPDPWWLINNQYCIVAEDKIYESDDKQIVNSHIRQALTHKDWVKGNLNNKLNENSEIITIFITNSSSISDSDRMYCDNLYYINKNSFIDWARNAIASMRKLKHIFGEEGNLLWREEAEVILTNDKVTPKDYIDFIKYCSLSKI